MKRFLTRFRFLPATIFAAVLMLSFRIGDIWEGVDGLLSGTLSVAEAQAQQTQPTTEDAAAGSESSDAEKAMEGGEGGEQTDDTMADDTADRRAIDDPTLLTQSEIELLQQLAERRETLDNREREIEQREGLLQAAEVRINEKVIELRALQATIEQLIKTYDDQQEAKIGSLVKIYENMKPKDAARIFEELDMDTLLLVAERMKERKLAPLMAQMNPEKAKEMTVELAKLRQLPRNGEDNVQ